MVADTEMNYPVDNMYMSAMVNAGLPNPDIPMTNFESVIYALVLTEDYKEKRKALSLKIFAEHMNFYDNAIDDSVTSLAQPIRDTLFLKEALHLFCTSYILKYAREKALEMFGEEWVNQKMGADASDTSRLLQLLNRHSFYISIHQ